MAVPSSQRVARTARVAAPPARVARSAPLAVPVAAPAPAASLDLFRASPGAISAGTVLRLQSQLGNHAVRRLLESPAQVSRAAGQPPGALVQRANKAKQPAAAAQAADEVALSTVAKWAKKGFEGWFLERVKEHADAWGLAVSSDAVGLKKLLIGGKAKPAMVLKWDAAWGTRPINNPSNFELDPVDAMMAVAGSHALPGWKKVPSGDQDILDNLLGGETNQNSAAARKHLRTQFPDLKTKSAKDQAKGLCAVMTDKAAEADVVAEPVTTAKVSYKLSGATKIKDFEFRGLKANAESYVAKFKDGADVTIIAPRAPKSGFHNHSVKQTAESAAYLPKAARKLITQVVLNATTNPDDPFWAVEYATPNFHSYMTAGAAGVVTIYPDKKTNALPTDNYRHGTMAHETGHTWSYKKWGTDTTAGRWVDWKAAMDKDKVAVSAYARASIAEDVAETIQVFVTTKGSPKFFEYKAQVPARFAILAADYTA